MRGSRVLTELATVAAAGAARGLYGMTCWNGLSPDQQRSLLDIGVLPFGHWRAEGDGCLNGATIGVESIGDQAPGPRFYCGPCAVEYTTQLAEWLAEP